MKNIFNKKLFVEAFRQIRIAYALFFGIIVGLSGLITFVNIYDAKKIYETMQMVTTISLVDSLLPLMLTFALVVPILTLILFKFLTKRNASDFYHTIPLKRNCIMFTYIATILAATLIIVVISSLIPIIGYSIADKYITFSTTAAFDFAINVLVCSILTLGAILISSSLTGTLSTNVLFALIILFGPRIFISIIISSLQFSLEEILPSSLDYGILSSRYNMVFESVSAFFIDGELQVLTELSISTLYTLLLGIIYIVLGFIAFNKRKSEQAESSLNNPVAHHTIRLCIGLFFGLSAVQNYFAYADEEYYAEYGFIEIGMFALAGFAFMTAYEMITTKKIKKMINVLISVPVVIAISLVVHVFLNKAETNILNYEPDSDNVEYIQLSTDNSFDDNYDMYFDYKLTQIKFNNNDIIDFISDAYNFTLDSYIECINNDNYYVWLPDYMQKYNEVTIRFCEDGIKHDRTVYLNDAEYNEFLNLIYSTDEYIDMFRNFPEVYESAYSTQMFNEEETKKIMNVLQDEIAELSTEEIAKLFAVSDMYDESIFEFYFVTLEGATEYCLDVYISDTTPKTLETILEILDDNIKNQEASNKKIESIVSDIDAYNNDYSYLYLTFDITNLETHEKMFFALVEYEKQAFNDEDYEYENYEDYIADIKDFITNRSDSSDSKYIVTVYGDASLNGNYTSIETFFFSDDCNFLNALSKYYENLSYEEEIYFE